jgi:hypothetical protein
MMLGFVGRIAMLSRSLWSLAVLAHVPLAAAQNTEPAVVPVENASYHVPVFSNDYVTVLNVQIPPRRASGYHRHSLDSVAVLMSDATRTNQTLGAEPVARAAQPSGTVTFTAYGSAPLVHTVAVQGEQTFHNIVVELEQSGAGGFSPAERPAPYTKVQDNERVRVWRLALEPGQTAPAITQQAPGVRVVVAGGELVESVPGAPERAMAPRAAEFYWQEAGTTRALRNAGTGRLELVELELK